MGILDDLKAKREAPERALAEEKARRRNRQAFCERYIDPRLKRLYTNLNELADHLNYLKPDKGFAYPFPTIGELGGFRRR